MSKKIQKKTNDEFDTETVICPSGLTGNVRNLCVKDIKMLSQKGNRNKDVIGKLLTSIWCETIDAGVYVNDSVVSESGVVDWNAALAGDRAFLIYEARRITFGPEFYFTTTCSACGIRNEQFFNISEVVRSGLSETAIHQIKMHGAGNARIDVELPKSGRKMMMKLFQGHDQMAFERASSSDTDDSGLSGLLLRVPYIEGCESHIERSQFIDGMSLVDMYYLQEQWEKHDVVIEDEIEFECNYCHAIDEVRIPVDSNFFSIKSTKSKKKLMS